MAKQPYMIVPKDVGLQTDVAPWMILDNAYTILEDAYVRRSRLIQRECNQFLGILVHEETETYVGEVTNVDITWNNTGSPLTNLPISPNSVTITINTLVMTDNGLGVIVGDGTGTIDYYTGEISVSFAAIGGVGPYNVVVQYEYYPYLPVTGLRSRETGDVNKEQLIAFDTRRSNRFNLTTNFFNDNSYYYNTAVPVRWTGDESNLFWTTNYQGAMFATNNVPGYYATPVAGSGSGDGIRYYFENSLLFGWVNFMPLITATEALKGALLILPYKDRLVCLSTVEGITATPTSFTRFAQRARWCQNGTAFYNATAIPPDQTADVNSWRDDINGRGGFIDAPTQEEIIGAGFVRDTLIVKFERSTWQLRYTSNEALPFVWQRVDAELGSEATFSEITFDKGLLGISSRGVITSNGNSSERIDIPIPDQVFTISAVGKNFERIYGIRDFYKQMVFWSYISANNNFNWPDKLLVYNYRDNTWAVWNDSYTALGYFQDSGSDDGGNDFFWDTYDVDWDEADIFWDGSGGTGTSAQSFFQDIIGGTNMGYVMILNKTSFNEPQIPISNISQATQAVVTTPGDHNLQSGMIIQITDVLGMTEINDLNTEIEVINATSFACINIDSTAFTAYSAGGQITRINGMKAISKRFNPFVTSGSGIDMSYIDLYVDTVPNREVSVNIYTSGNTTIPVNQNLWQTEVDLSSPNVDFPVDSFWTRFNCRTSGQFVQMEIFFTKEQLLDNDKNDVGFVLNGITLWLEPRTRIV